MVLLPHPLGPPTTMHGAATAACLTFGSSPVSSIVPQGSLVIYLAAARTKHEDQSPRLLRRKIPT